MRSVALDLFQEYADAYASGERPLGREYVERAPAWEQDRVAGLIDRFLMTVPRLAATGEDLAQLDAWLTEPPLLELRRRRGLRVNEIVDALVSALALDGSKRLKVKRYYQQLEGGVLDPRGVTQAVWDALASVLQEPPTLPLWHPARPLRSLSTSARTPMHVRGSFLRQRHRKKQDDVDELFTGARSTPSDSANT